MWAKLKPALIISRREVRDQFRDWRIIFPILGLTLFFPFLMNFTARQVLNFVSRYNASILADRLVPFLLMIVGFFPISASLVIALESFVGEKERGSIEPLLNTPLKDWQLYLGKLISSTVPPLLSSFIGMAIYVAGLHFQGLQLPEWPLLIEIVTLTVVQAIVMVAGAVVVSSQATSVRSANLLASFIIIPISLLIQAESVVMFWGNFEILWLIVFGLLILTVLLVRVGLAHFQREELLGREIDVLNLRWGWRVFIQAFKGRSQSLGGWFLKEIPATLHRLRLAVGAMLFIILAALILGYSQVGHLSPGSPALKLASADVRLENLVTKFPLFAISPVLSIFWQNLRSMIISILLGIFSFGIIGVLPAILTFGLLGYISGLLAVNQVPVWIYLVGFILPHGILEIPAIIISGAAVLQMGAILATPTPGKTIGEVWLAALADWVKLMLGLVIPLLLLAALIEAWLTPRLALWLIH
jgi:uncharacterized membrane protein SpoIIM required for sporulation